MTEREFQNLESYFVWMAAVGYMMEELGIKDTEANLGIGLYEEFLDEREKLVYNPVQLQ